MCWQVACADTRFTRHRSKEETSTQLWPTWNLTAKAEKPFACDNPKNRPFNQLVRCGEETAARWSKR